MLSGTSQRVEFYPIVDMKTRLFLFVLLAFAFPFGAIAQFEHPSIGTTVKSEDGAFAITLIGKKQQYSKAERDTWDQDVRSPKSVNIHPNGTKYYVNSLEAAKRELMEETGLRLISIDDHIGMSYSAVGFSNEMNVCVVGKCEGDIRLSDSSFEEIHAAWYTRKEVRELLKTERFAARTQAYCYLWSRED